MSFAKHLEEKILVDRLAGKVAATLGPPGSGARIDKASMRELLARSHATPRSERDLEMFLWPSGPGKNYILVLDNELAVFADTTVEEVCIRKSPYVKEMIYNFVKILYTGKNVVRTRGRETLDAVRRMCLKDLDLSFDRRDIQNLREQAGQALVMEDPQGVRRFLELFAEILGYADPPVSLNDPDVTAKGALVRDPDGRRMFGPAVLFHAGANRLVWVQDTLDAGLRENREALLAMASGKKPVKAQGHEALASLENEVVSRFGLQEGVRADLKDHQTMII